jgi:hypothetical protein
MRSPRFGPACSGVAHSKESPALHPRLCPTCRVRTFPVVIRSCLVAMGARGHGSALLHVRVRAKRRSTPQGSTHPQAANLSSIAVTNHLSPWCLAHSQGCGALPNHHQHTPRRSRDTPPTVCGAQHLGSTTRHICELEGLRQVFRHLGTTANSSFAPQT